MHELKIVNPLKNWFDDLPNKNAIDARNAFMRKFELPRSSFYNMLREDYTFNPTQKLAYNTFAFEFNNSVIFE